MRAQSVQGGGRPRLHPFRLLLLSSEVGPRLDLILIFDEEWVRLFERVDSQQTNDC